MLEMIEKAILKFPQSVVEKKIYLSTADYLKLTKKYGGDFDTIFDHKVIVKPEIEEGMFYVSPKLTEED